MRSAWSDYPNRFTSSLLL